MNILSISVNTGRLIVSGQVSGQAYPGIRAKNPIRDFSKNHVSGQKILSGIFQNLMYPGKNPIRDFSKNRVSGHPGSRMHDQGPLILDTGSRTLDPGSWTLDLGSWTLDLGSWILDLGSWIQGPWIQLLRDANQPTRFKIYPGIRANFVSWPGYYPPASLSILNSSGLSGTVSVRTQNRTDDHSDRTGMELN